jgi:hypothetical protein
VIRAPREEFLIDGKVFGYRVRFCGCLDFADHVLIGNTKAQIYCCVACGLSALRAVRKKGSVEGDG